VTQAKVLRGLSPPTSSCLRDLVATTIAALPADREDGLFAHALDVQSRLSHFPPLP